MYWDYFKLIFRKLVRSRLYTAINIGGLTVALTVALLIYSYVVKEIRTDRFHVQGEYIYRATSLTPGKDVWYTAFCSPMGENAKKEIPGVKEFVRIVAPQTFLVKKESNGEFLPEERCLYTDPQFFSVLSFPLVAGEISPDTEPGWAVISETTAWKYFGEGPAVGKMLVLREPQMPEDLVYHVVGVMKDMPARSSLRADILLDFKQVADDSVYGGGNALTTLLQLEPKADVEEVANAIPLMEARYSDFQKQLNKRVVLQPLYEMYLHSDHIRDYETVFSYGSLPFNYMLSGIALLIVLLASCNYLTIKLAQLHKSAAMYAIQRCFGAGNRSMRQQIYLETGMHIVLALFAAVWLMKLLHPYFVGIVSSGQMYELDLSGTEYLCFIGFVLLFIALTGYVLSGWMLRRLDRKGIKDCIRKKGRGWDLKQGLLVGQMCIFCGLFFASLLLSRQMDFIRNKPIGYDNRNVLCVDWPGDETSILSEKNELMSHPDIIAVTNGRPLPDKGEMSYEVYAVSEPEKKVKARALLGDENYLETYSVQLLEGRKYRGKEGAMFFYNGPGKPGEGVINQKMVKELGLENPIGEVLNYGNSVITVVGVVEDFHYKSLYQPVEPLMIGACLPGFDSNLSIRYREGKRQNVLEYLQKYCRENYAGVLLQYSEYNYTSLYARDIALVKMTRILTILAICISAMGILAFSMFVAKSRTKEVAMRKINGATEWQVIGLLNRSFVCKMFGACLIALPVAYWVTESWLRGFAYRTNIDWWLFVLDVLVSLMWVLLITTWQTWQAASANPVEALKVE